jgi:YD repeat-containing protein
VALGIGRRSAACPGDKERAPASGGDSYAYDAVGRMTTSTAPDGSQRGTVFDAVGRVSKTENAGAVTSCGYDLRGQLTCVNDGSDTAPIKIHVEKLLDGEVSPPIRVGNRRGRVGKPMFVIECETGERIEVPGDTLVGINLSHANLHRAILDSLCMEGAQLEGADLRSASMKGTRLNRGNLQNARLMAVRAEGVCLSQADLRAAWLNGANLSCSDLRNASLLEADLFGANLSAAMLIGADLRCRRWDQAIWKGACADSTTRWPEGFDPLVHGLKFV